MPRQKTKPRAAEKDALTLLKEDHDTVRGLLSELEEAEGKKRLVTLRNRAISKPSRNTMS
jgi:hypothetical protein